MTKRLDPRLLFSTELPHRKPYNAELNAHGSYNTFDFVLRLSPVVHQTLRGSVEGKSGIGSFRMPVAQAFSTLLHETVHWWQHIGSTYGFMLSMMYPAQSQANHGHLRRLLEGVGFKKSIRQLSLTLPQLGMGSPSAIANTIVNNHFDLEAYATFTYSVGEAKEVSTSKQFEGEGHAFHITLDNTLALLSATFDPECKVIPDARQWQQEFRDLRRKKVQGFYYGSPVGLWPLGAREIFEGQARFSQIQYLSFGSGGQLQWQDFREHRMLKGVYVAAFNKFLELSGLPWPETIEHATTALFLAVCDISLNPGAAFPYPLTGHAERIHIMANPAGRFAHLCEAIRHKIPLGSFKVTDYSREEYEALVDRLCAVAGLITPLQIAETFSQWAETPTLKPLMLEHEAYEFKNANLAIRVLFTHFLAFMRDKNKYPEFFCWPGAWMAGRNAGDRAAELFERHGALFIDRDDKEGVYPRLLEGIDEKRIQKVFDNFYGSCVSYDLTNQWITNPGPFMYDFAWLVGDKSTDEVKRFADRHFEGVYGVKPDDVELVPDA